MYQFPLPASAKSLARAAMPSFIWRQLKEMQRNAAFNGAGPYSFDESAILQQIDAQSDLTHFFVDIGAQDGVLGSQTLALAKRGWAGVCYEADEQLCTGMQRRYLPLPDVMVRREWITPANVLTLLQRDNVPTELGFISLDIDSYDLHVLNAILDSYSPKVICVEINEMIPPPIYFSVNFNESAGWMGDRFQGFSIQAAKDICNRFGYSIGQLHYNNLLLYKSARPGTSVTDDDICEAFTRGYIERADRDQLFPWNKPYSHLLSLPAPKALSELQSLFSDNLDHCVLRLDREDV